MTALRWQRARGRWSPHEYSVRDWAVEAGQTAAFDLLLDLIRQHGENRQWDGRDGTRAGVYRYAELDGMLYWRSAGFQRMPLINRRPVGEPEPGAQQQTLPLD